MIKLDEYDQTENGIGMSMKKGHWQTFKHNN